MRNIFLDVGAHWGETLDEVLSPLWAYDLVYAIEPDEHAVRILTERFKDEISSGRLVIVPVALSNRDGFGELFGSNDGGGATLYKEKRDIDEGKVHLVRLCSASNFFRENLAAGDNVIAKLNCEGGEVDILNDLCDSGEIQKIKCLIVDFDIKKVRGRKHEAKLTIERMRSVNFDRFLQAHEAMVGPSHRERLRNAFACMLEASAVCTDIEVLPNPPRRQKLSRRVRNYIRSIF